MVKAIKKLFKIVIYTFIALVVLVIGVGMLLNDGTTTANKTVETVKEIPKVVEKPKVVKQQTAEEKLHCLYNIGEYAKTDDMINSYIISDKGHTVVYVNNIRNMKAVDIGFYGFNKDMALSMEKNYVCKNVKFEDAYTNLGLPRFN